MRCQSIQYIFPHIFFKVQKFHVRKIYSIYLLASLLKFKNFMSEKSILYICSHLFQSSRILCSKNQSHIFAHIFFKVQKFYIWQINPHICWHLFQSSRIPWSKNQSNLYLLTSFWTFKNSMLEKINPNICSYLFKSSKILCSTYQSQIFAGIFVKVQEFHFGKMTVDSLANPHKVPYIDFRF